MSPETLIKKYNNLYLCLFYNERQKYLMCVTSGRLNLEKIIPTIYFRVFPSKVQENILS